MFGRLTPPSTSSVFETVQAHLGEADNATVTVVAAMASLLAAVAYADREWSPSEHQQLEVELGRVQGLSAAGARAITELLSKKRLELATTQLAQSTRALREHADRELRLEILELLVGIAAADSVIELAEVTMLRNITTMLGLTQDDYNAVQSRHEEKLSFI